LPEGQPCASIGIGGWAVSEALLDHTVGFQSAHDAVRRAKRALRDAELRFDTDCGPDNTTALMNEIRTAERRLADAVSALDKMPRSSSLLAS
jgi:hypothetical protein